jgi:integrase
MPAYRDARSGRWRYRKSVRVNGRLHPISGTPTVNTKVAAEAAERDHIALLSKPEAKKQEVPTFGEWFNGRFWDEWVIGRKNKHSEQESKASIYRIHLASRFSSTPIDCIGVGEVAAFRASLVKAVDQDGKPRFTEKRINNILAVLSKALHYAEDVDLITKAPKVGIFKVEAPEIECWTLEEYPRIIAAAESETPQWHAAVLLAGDAGLRIGEAKALRWAEDVDLVAGTITVNQQIRRKVVGTPKGRTRRTIPMTPRLLAALKALPVVRTGFVLRSRFGTALHDTCAERASRRFCRLAGLPGRGWHALRHSFGTHAALFGVNPWHLMAWMGHKRVEQTMRYVHFAGAHLRPLPAEIIHAGAAELDPQARIIKMLGARNCNTATTLQEQGRNSG